MQVGSIITLTASAKNGANTTISPTFIYRSTDSSILDVAPNGVVCAGVWNAPLYSVCTPGATGQVEVTATALGSTSAPTLFFVHAPVDNIQISVLPPANAQPPACPGQTLPASCNLQFNPTAANYCLSQNQVQTLQAKAFSKGADITDTVGTFTWNEVNGSVITGTPIEINPSSDPSLSIATNQLSVSPSTPGQTQVIATASGISSEPYYIESCPVQCIDLEVGVNGLQRSGQTSFVVGKGTSETVTATAVDVQGCIVPKPPLTWVSSSPAAISAGGSTGCGSASTCSLTTTQPGSAAITASCSPPTCNIGFPLNPLGSPDPYDPKPVYPITTISGLVTGATTATSVMVTSRDCSTNAVCGVALYNASTSTNQAGNPTALPSPPNSLMFDPPGDKAYAGSEFGAIAISPGNIGGTTSPFSSLSAPGTPLGLVIGSVIAVSPNGNQAIFSDTVSTPNQVYVAGSVAAAASAAYDINSATAAAFSPDELKAFILGNGGNSLYVYSNLQSLQPPIALPSPATAVTFNSSGSFAVLSGGATPGTFPGPFAVYNTCDNSEVTFTPPPPPLPTLLPAPPLFLKMVPAGNVATGNTIIPALQMTGLDLFFGVDNTGIDIVGTTSSLFPSGQNTPAPACTRPIVFAQTMANTTFYPVHISVGQGTFHPINFFVSPDATQVFIVTSDLGVLVYHFNTQATTNIALANNATPIAADMTVDGSLIYVAASDGLLHILNTTLGIEQQTPIVFSPLPNSTNSFCYTGDNCAANLVAVKP